MYSLHATYRIRYRVQVCVYTVRPQVVVEVIMATVTRGEKDDKQFFEAVSALIQEYLASCQDRDSKVRHLTLCTLHTQ